jgi:hypothetical protein
MEGMARGFESKQVESQQEEAARGRIAIGPVRSAEEVARLDRQRTLELSIRRARQDLSRATAPAHRLMLEHAIASLAAELRALGGASPSIDVGSHTPE